MSETADSLTHELRQWPSPSEARIWAALRGHRLEGASFRRRRPIGRYVADFVCDAAKLIVVVVPDEDADVPSEAVREHEVLLVQRGYQILHIPADEIISDFGSVLSRIRAALPAAKSEPAAPEGES